MFKQSVPKTIDIFSNWEGQLSGRRLEAFTDPQAWHNVFYNLVTSRIDERPFSVLFSKKMGRGNAPVRILVAMNILKEGHGWSDEELYDQCSFNLKVMKALGLNNMHDEVPVLSTWYLFRQRLAAHQQTRGENLLGDCFTQLTRTHAEIFGVNGMKLRMDSTLIGSNIVKSSRLQLIIGCLREFYKHLSIAAKMKLSEEDVTLLESLMKQKPGNLTYKLNAEGQAQKLEELGLLLMRLVRDFDEPDSEKYSLIKRVFEEQYSQEATAITLKKDNDIDSNSLQSPHDADAAYRNKAGEKVQGFSVNISETCNDEGLNIITNVQVEKATRSDVHHLNPALQESEAVVGAVEKIYADGGYYNPGSKETGKEICFTGIQGAVGRWAYQWENGQLQVTDTFTRCTYPAEEYKEGRFRFIIEKEGKKKRHYVVQKAVDAFFKREEIKNLPAEERNKRANVEATIFQLLYHTRNKKTRYRTQFKHSFWANIRALWINFRRMLSHLMGENCPEHLKNQLSTLFNIKLQATGADYQLQPQLLITFFVFQVICL